MRGAQQFCATIVRICHTHGVNTDLFLRNWRRYCNKNRFCAEIAGSVCLNIYYTTIDLSACIPKLQVAISLGVS
jgi:hypothetical protein